jgi:hypothetical protein
LNLGSAPILGALFLQANRKPECRTLPRDTGETNVTSHQSDKTLHDGESQTSPSKSSRHRPIGLSKRIKDLFLGIEWNPDSGIAYRYFEQGIGQSILNTLNVKQNAASFRKLYGIPY